MTQKETSGGAPDAGRCSFEELRGSIARGWCDTLGTKKASQPTLTPQDVSRIWGALRLPPECLATEAFAYVISRWSALVRPEDDGAYSTEEIEFGSGMAGFDTVRIPRRGHGSVEIIPGDGPKNLTIEAEFADFLNASAHPRGDTGTRHIQSPKLKASWKRLLKKIQREAPERKKTKPRQDHQREAAELPAIIFYRYTGKRPTRVVRKDRGGSDRDSRFFKFARAAFEAISTYEGFSDIHEVAFRDTCKWWPALPEADWQKKAREFFRHYMRMKRHLRIPG